jgi:cyclopropane-fatty-acyl-phospholipid synthase
LFMAARYPSAKITAVSNSASQREYIETEAKRRGLSNIQVLTCDMNDFDLNAHIANQVDRIVSVEMFEHMRNYRALFKRLHGWLKPDGKFFMHIFVHRSVPYEFAEKDSSDWMSRYFFSGGIMPSHDLPLYFQDHLRIEQRWTWDGTHYEKTANAWLQNVDANQAAVLSQFTKTYGAAQATLWLQRWRIFFMACAELWGYRNGQEWFVSHYLFVRR